eukprot:CAMPEP_0198210970 /NCGR_PEP_ID=MMETSP1445-20131203/22547_1 /TAXON_ID=36898 /ORGANISM="Pyramimonas sp., Strain CCMP2087" /LENGTH=394 /DNA_ID=CAMNT_0043885143 /DNA_START=66 /DNA_END=1250 /DNA_ORIENTATION=+
MASSARNSVLPLSVHRHAQKRCAPSVLAGDTRRRAVARSSPSPSLFTKRYVVRSLRKGVSLSTSFAPTSRAAVRIQTAARCSSQRDSESEILELQEEGPESEEQLPLSMALLLLAAAAPGAAEAAADLNPFFTFNPVCPASDTVFRGGQRLAINIAGDQNIEDYRPLINDVLIRVRTELCVLESFIRETAIPFIQVKGVGWILPLHETNETYLAGVVFMLGLNFILLGSTKVVAIISIYHDLALGVPTRLLGNLLSLADRSRIQEKYDRELEKVMKKQMGETKKVMGQKLIGQEAREGKLQELNSRFNSQMEELKKQQEAKDREMEGSTVGRAGQVASTIAVPLKIYGQTSKTIRTILEVFDTFCSRYFVAFTVTYIIVKTLHFFIFPNFPTIS